MSPCSAPGRRVSPRGEAPPRGPGRAAGRPARAQARGPGPEDRAWGTKRAARPGLRLGHAGLVGGGEEGGEGAAVGGSDPRAEAPTRKLGSQLESFWKGEPPAQPAPPPRARLPRGTQILRSGSVAVCSAPQVRESGREARRRWPAAGPSSAREKHSRGPPRKRRGVQIWTPWPPASYRAQGPGLDPVLVRIGLCSEPKGALAGEGEGGPGHLQ